MNRDHVEHAGEVLNQPTEMNSFVGGQRALTTVSLRGSLWLCTECQHEMRVFASPEQEARKWRRSCPECGHDMSRMPAISPWDGVPELSVSDAPSECCPATAMAVSALAA